MDQPPDVELLARVGRGEEPAFAELVRRHGPYLFGVARPLVTDTHEAEDVVQETFAAVVRGSDFFRGQASVRTWLVSIAVRQAAMVRRKRRPWLRLWRPEDDASPPTAANTQNAVEARLDLTDLLAQLSPEHREVIVLRELEGMSYDEMAQTLSVPRGTVESRLHRAREHLRRLANMPHDRPIERTP